ncbi:MAG: ribonuclease H-like domain-containing protein [Candidatus Cloacimonas sp.]|nr:ribonuclease H-like domain-containing protein [Candidatus Cloacimonas sp.]
MIQDMHQDREFYASELKELLRETLKHSIEGEFSAHSEDPYFYTQKEYPLQTEIEGLALYPEFIPEVLLNWANLDTSKERKKEDILFLDLETTGLRSNGIFAFMIGLGYYVNEQFIVEQIFLPDPEAEVNSFDRLLELVNEKSLLITFNGKTFDIPVLESRLLYHQIWLNLRAMEHLDLLHLARRLWKNKLPSCALETIEFYILGQIRDKELDIEGGEIPQTYFSFLLNGNPELMQRVFLHNHTDILHTAALFTLICNSISYPPQGGMDSRIDYHSLAMLYQSQNRIDIAKNILEDMLSAGITDKDVLRDLGFIYKKEKDMESALKCFNIASSLNCPVSMHETCIILEKYYKRYGEALNIAEKLKSYLISRPIVNDQKVAAIDKRIARLKLKLNKVNEVI